jgi:hypothetical protein
MENLLYFFLIFISLEIFESNWQKSDTFYGMIKNNYQAYKKGIFAYILLNPTFIYSIFLSYYFQNFTFIMTLIIGLKFADISFKLHLLNKIDKNEDINEIIPMDMEMNNMLRYLNVIIYPTTFLLSII